ncbi:Ubiquinone biosynthesis monooxygenase COQ6, mitochondrial [Golovinomyces cichoracearum]|uniref:Ubiquinone biosynthesis monooxygenase COQ6, mitochondrial n=1 Tax=Golovinomyces cichoracearum TaxID=62708 RepID=A0A420H8D1_9PEZI|nr:Ubiquinone biosynthesis monooxygenase COQ6, mitochondrial [Golovinomyces cichoracearum]
MKLLSNISKIRPALHVCRNCTTQQGPYTRSYATNLAKESPEIFDIVCVGGGTAGLSLLAALRSSPVTANLKLALVDNQNVQSFSDFSLPPTQFSSRCSSLTPSTVRFLDEIGAWKHIQLGRTQAYQEMQVWDGVSGARIEFNWQAHEKGKTIAYMTENQNLSSALMKRIEELDGVKIFDSQRLVNICYGEETEQLDLREWPVLQLSSGSRLAARLLVGADGVNSPVRTFTGIDSRGWDYDRVGLVATLQSKRDGNKFSELKTAYQRFLPTGPVALLPLPENYSTLVWTTTVERASLLKNLSTKDFVAMVNAAFRLSPTDLTYMHTIESTQENEFLWRSQHSSFEAEKIPPEIVEVQSESIASFPLKLKHVDKYIEQRVALIGDAAHSMHPLAGQGLNLGQADVESLVKAIRFAVTHGEDIGTIAALESYNADRYAANHLILGVVDKLHKLYSVENGPLIPLRSIGLRAVNTLGPLKYFFMEQAAGTGARIRLDPGKASFTSC